MSYRELRSFIEAMRTLHYPRLISFESFRSPNFALVAELLSWLAQRLGDKNTITTHNINQEQGRVKFVRSVAQFMARTVNVKLNTKRLYQADGHAVKELLKVTSVLTAVDVDAVNMGSSGGENSELSASQLLHEITGKMPELKTARNLASEITTKGSSLFELVGHEAQLRELRDAAVSRGLDLAEVEAALKRHNDKLRADIERTKTLIASVSTDEASLDAKIEKKQVELERNQKRLATLKKVRPAFMDEFERLEAELRVDYDEYVNKFRCLAFLEQQLEEYEKAEYNRMSQKEEVRRKQLEQLNLKEELVEPQPLPTDLTVAAAATSSGMDRPQRAAARVYGSMQADFEELDSDASLDFNADELAEAELLSDEEIELGSDRPQRSSANTAVTTTRANRPGTSRGTHRDATIARGPVGSRVSSRDDDDDF